ncbi:MAG: FAD-dependent oxidoreductase [Candidatus Terrybacteria bacterium]|nr:FAD-dependent oxidoreductase [Candidatus Terrybacteria bacterium]
MIYDVVIIGGASAGLTAAIYTARKKLSTVILTKQVGGQSLLTDTIENFPGFETISGRELIEKMQAQVEKYGVEIMEGAEVEEIENPPAGGGKDFLIKLKNQSTIEARSIIIATGKNPRWLGIPGEKEFENKGVVFCTTCDAPLFGGKNVAVVGGGNSGLNSALDLVKYANKIYVLEFGPKIIGDELLQEKLRQSGKVEFIVNADPKEIKGTNFVEKIIYKDKSANRRTGKEKELLVGGVFINIGWIPATDFLKGFIDLNEEREIVINPKTNETSVPGVFAAGDVTDVKYKQCVIAAGEGAKAALSAYNYLVSNS